MKTGIITFHFVNNFGGALQAYALRRFVAERFDADAELIDFRHWFIRLTDAARMLPLTPNVRFYGPWLRSYGKMRGRRRKFAEFIRREGHPSKRADALPALEKLSANYDLLICGSDQLWNPMLTCGLAKPYFLRFGRGRCRRISYAVSVGAVREADRARMLGYVKDLDAVSIREPVDWLEAALPVEHHIDPTLLLETGEWDAVAVPPAKGEDYILTYFMQMNEAAYKAVADIKAKTGLKVVDISRYGYKPECVDECLVDLGPAEFVGLFQHAKRVCTNSFHGLVFSLIFDKPVDYVQMHRFGGRVENLCALLNIKRVEAMGGAYFHMEYDPAEKNAILARERQRTVAYLSEHIGPVGAPARPESPMVRIDDKARCCGCGGCAQACPAGCIEMRADREGFQYPVVDEGRCVQCGRCKAVCPVLRAEEERARAGGWKTPKALGGWNRDEAVRRASSSGGAFTLLAGEILGRGGVVFGAVMNGRRVEHVAAESLGALAAMRGSKYVQSDLGDSYRQVREYLRAGRPVLFTGTPCQTSGLVTFLGGRDENLVLVDFVCHGVPSPRFFSEYLDSLERKAGARVTAFSFRDKEKGWYSVGSRLQVGPRARYDNGAETSCYPALRDSYTNGFLEDCTLRPSCYACPFKGVPKWAADITLADFWGVDEALPGMNDKKGTSLLLIHSDKGMALFDAIKDRFEYRECDWKAAVSKNPSLLRSSKRPELRDRIFDELDADGYDRVARRHLTAGRTIARKLSAKLKR